MEDQERASRRVALLLSHLDIEKDDKDIKNTEEEEEDRGTLHIEECAATQTIKIDVDKLFVLLQGAMLEEKMRIKAKVDKDPLFRVRFEMTKEEWRDRALQQLKTLGSHNMIDVRDIKLNPMRYLKLMEAIGIVDASMAVKAGVQFTLFGGTIVNLGSERHEKYIPMVNSLELPGAFAMTELGHGSNVRGLETEARYDRATMEFDIHSPTVMATKWWLGNAALHGKMASVFANLIIGDENYGVHVFLVPIRDMVTHEVLPGVSIGDCGPKVGLHGIDNGWIRFNHVRVPRENLLNRFGDVTEDGIYTSPLPSAGKRFAALLGELTTGRVSIVGGSSVHLNYAVTVATRYAAKRRQFGLPGEEEMLVLDYSSHQRKLMPMLATAYAFIFAKEYMWERYASAKAYPSPDSTAEVHVLSSGLKAVTSWYVMEALSVCRESMGGQGYSAFNRIGMIRDDHDIFQTFEGDNTVLMQQVARDLLLQYKQQFIGKKLRVAMQYLGVRARSVSQKRNPVVTRYGAAHHLRSSTFQLGVFRFRANSLLEEAVRRLQRATRKHRKGFHAWNKCLDILVHMGVAHIELVILKQFVHTVHRCTDPSIRTILKKLCDLYALSWIERDMGTFRNLEIIKSGKAHAIHMEVAKLCQEVRMHALELVDAFGFADEHLAAPAGMKEGNVYDHILRSAMA